MGSDLIIIVLYKKSRSVRATSVMMNAILEAYRHAWQLSALNQSECDTEF